MKITKIVITHPLYRQVGSKLNLEEQATLARKGVFIEHTMNATSPLRDNLHPNKIVEAIKAVGAEHCILTTDYGQIFNPVPAEGMRMMIAVMLESGCSEAEIELMVKTNPVKLLDL
jgi:microsomal dipeptidase-like Zn-dependent dipeptidase